MTPGEAWTLVQFLVNVSLVVLWYRLRDRLDRTERRLAESRIDTFNLVDALVRNAATEGNYFREPFDKLLMREFPHLYDVDERGADERAAERAS